VVEETLPLNEAGTIGFPQLAQIMTALPSPHIRRVLPLTYSS
jgi:hypothetical protein